jgi:hypothetical protein
LLGPRPRIINAHGGTQPKTFADLSGAQNDFLARIETLIPPDTNGAAAARIESPELLTAPSYFCIPKNETLLKYWDTVADRLFKIRHCMNIEGAARELPIFEPPIDPALLVRAAAAGVDLSSVLNDVQVSLPHYRFQVMAQKATELCADLRALGSAFLSALEKRDAEAMALLRSGHELRALEAVKQVRVRQIDEAREALEALKKSRQLADIRFEYYANLEFMNDWEKAHLALFGASTIFQTIGQAMQIFSAGAKAFPDVEVGIAGVAGTPFATVKYGGTTVGGAAEGFAHAVSMLGSLTASAASMSATMGGYQRRAEEWALQKDLAAKEQEQIDRQILGSEIRVELAERELENHELQIENARQTDTFMRDKFTNRELYDWMVSQISATYFQSYQLAYDVAKRAERAYRYELGLRDSSFIQFGYWDSLKKGLLAGERLAHDLKRMEVAFLDQNKREYEIAKHISLRMIDPLSLSKLKETGECFVTLPEALFDVDYPGHYLRRIKSVGITVPCVAGPYTGISCTLTLHSSSIRHDNTLAAGKYVRQADDLRFADSTGTIESIVTSSAQNDSGLFEPNLRDERYLPFEGQGAISTWRLELPRQFRSFDYDTISDVVFHLRYTAREGGSLLKEQAAQELQAALNEFIRTEGQQGLAQVFSLRHEFSTEWSRFLNAPEGSRQTLTMALTEERFPFLFHDRTIAINAIELLVKVKPEFSASHNKSTLRLSLRAGAAASNDPLTLSEWNSLLRTAASPGGPLGDWTLTAWLTADETEGRLDPNAIQDLLAVCRYTCS